MRSKRVVEKETEIKNIPTDKDLLEERQRYSGKLGDRQMALGLGLVRGTMYLGTTGAIAKTEKQEKNKERGEGRLKGKGREGKGEGRLKGKGREGRGREGERAGSRGGSFGLGGTYSTHFHESGELRTAVPRRWTYAVRLRRQVLGRLDSASFSGTEKQAQGEGKGREGRGQAQGEGKGREGRGQAQGEGGEGKGSAKKRGKREREREREKESTDTQTHTHRMT